MNASHSWASGERASNGPTPRGTSGTLGDLQRWWASRAFQMLHDRAHIEATDRILRVPQAVEFPGARWPGYLGSRVTEGHCVLAVANVHRELKSGRLRSDPGGEVAETVAATLALQRAETPTDPVLQAYIAGHGAAYRVGLSGAWDVGRDFADGFSASGVETTASGMDQVAYLNASCCQVPQDGRLAQDPAAAKRLAARIKKELKPVCIPHHKVVTVARRLRPRVILCTSAVAFDQLTADVTQLGSAELSSTVLVCFNQQVGHLQRPMSVGNHVILEHRRAPDYLMPKEWCAALSDFLRRRA